MGILVSSAASEISSNTFVSSSGMHSANGVSHLLSGKTKSLLRHFAWKEAARKKYAVRAAGIFHNMYSRKRNLFSGRSEWRQGMFVAVFLLLFFSAVSIFLSRHFFLLTINYIYIYNFSYFCTKFDQIWLAICWELNGCPIQARYPFRVSNSNLALVNRIF